MQLLHGRILAILSQRGISGRDYALRDDADGRGPYIGTWRTATLGAQPTDSELAAIPDAAALAAEKTAAGDAGAMTDVTRALILFYLRDKLGRNPTAPERQAAAAAFRQAYADVT